MDNKNWAKDQRIRLELKQKKKLKWFQHLDKREDDRRRIEWIIETEIAGTEEKVIEAVIWKRRDDDRKREDEKRREDDTIYL